jgi:hypothetical protein
MSTGDTRTGEPHRPTQKSADLRQLDAIAWALFFIWIGIALLAKIGWAWTLLGISAIILGAQGTLWRKDKKIAGFWVACGLVFLAGGVWELFGLTWPLAPVLVILLGLSMLWKAVFGTHAR